MIVCTGGSGTIGQFLPASVVRLGTRLEDSVEAHVEELRQLPSVPLGFIHLAAMTSVAEADKDPALAKSLNVDGSVKWFEAASQVGVKKFVYVSTSHVFQATSKRQALIPSRVSDATSVYGKTKAEAEKMLAAAAEHSSTELVIARVFSVTSPKMRAGFLYPDLLRRARERDFKVLPGHQNVRDFIDAEKAAETVLQVAQASDTANIIHVGSGIGKSVRQLAEEVMTANGISISEMQAMFPATTEPPNYLISDASGEDR